MTKVDDFIEEAPSQKPLHKGDKTTQAIRCEIQQSKENVRTLTRRLSGIKNSVLKRHKRNFVLDMPMGR